MNLKEFLYLPWMTQKLKEYPNCLFNFDSFISPGEKTVAKNVNNLSINIESISRESSRVLNNKKITNNDLLRICQLSYGFSSRQKRTVPSAGGYYPLKLCALQINNLGNIIQLLEFIPEENRFEDIGLKRPDVSLEDILDVYHVNFKSVQWAILWTANIIPISSKYGLKGMHFMSIEIGHSAQMAILACLENNYKHITIGGIKEKEILLKVLPYGRRFLPQYILLL